MPQHNERLFSDFPPVYPSEWEERIRADLKGTDYEKKLIWHTLDNLKLKPYYTAEDLQVLEFPDQRPGAFPFVRGNNTTGNHWDIRQDFRVYDPGVAGEHARLASARGLTSVGFDLSARESLTYGEFSRMVGGLDLTETSLNLVGGGMKAPELAGYLMTLAGEQHTDTKKLRGSVCFDPLTRMVLTGSFFTGEIVDFTTTAQLLQLVREDLRGFRILTIGSDAFSNAGASVVQELAFGLAMAAEYLTRMTDMGFRANEVTAHMQWNLGVGSSYFQEIAKLRAARYLFSVMLAAYEDAEKQNLPVYIHSITTSWNKTIYDPHVNILRITTEAMAAILGGCNSLLVKPYDSCFQEPGELSERISRNLQIILKEEAYFDKVADPAAGSYYIESLTASLVESAWKLFQQIDAMGGFISAFKQGFVRQESEGMAEKRRRLISTGKEVLLGTNRYPNPEELADDCIIHEIAFDNAPEAEGKVAEPLPSGRGAVEFEQLRLSTERHGNGRPKVFMLTYGNLAMRLARAQFAAGFFACAGYEVIDNLGFASAGEGVAAALDSGADIIVVCSSDEEYPSLVPEVYQQVNGRAIVVVAGAPACMDELRQKGIGNFIHLRTDVLETLKDFHKKLGIQLLQR
jgi:methylmalonyl-CoA mutase